MIDTAFLFALCAVAAALLTGIVRTYSLKYRIVDAPSDRGLHAGTVPRGGGAAIAVVVSGALVVLMMHHRIPFALGVPFVVGGICFAALGWLDDHLDLSMSLRLCVQLLLSALLVGALARSGLPAHSLQWTPGVYVSIIIAAVLMAWMVNLFNFMDGADGIATTEAIVVAVIGGAIVGIDADTPVGFIATAIAGGSAGFLAWNWAPAKIFMGDVGSYFLGFYFAGLLVHAAWSGSGAWIWLILLAPFVTDSTMTLLRRVLRRERWWQAHRSHVYQRLILNGWGHARVSINLAVLTFALLAPAAVAASRFPLVAPTITITIYAITVIMWFALLKATNRPQ